MSDWNHPICAADFHERQPDSDPVVITVPYREREVCCFCGKETDAGIYIREDPANAPFHVEEASDDRRA